MSGRITTHKLLTWVELPMKERAVRILERNRYLWLVLLLGFVLMVYGIWTRAPHAMGPDEKSAVTKALWLGVNRTPFLPDFTKGGKFYLYVLAVSFAPYYLYLKLTGRTGVLAEQATGSSTFFDAPPELKAAFYDFLLVGRFVSVILGLATLALVYMFVTEQHGKRRGLLASGVLAVGMGFVNTAHMATEDLLLTALLSLTFVLFAKYEYSGDDRVLWVASITSGLAVSTKLTAGFLVFPLVYFVLQDHLAVVHSRGVRSVKEPVFRILRSGTLALTAYVVTTPAILVYPGLYLTELSNESAAAFGQQAALPGWVLQFFNLARAFGLPLFVVCLVGLGYLVHRRRTDDGTRMEVGMLLFIVPYFVVIGSWQTSEVWYAIPLMPFFAAFASEPLSRMLDPSDRVSSLLVAAILLFSLVYTGATVQQISTDARIDSSEWIEEHVSTTAEVDVYMYPLHLPEFPDTVRVNRYWFNDSSGETFRTAKRRVDCAAPDYIVLSSAHYAPFVQNPNVDPAATSFYERLFDGETGYEVVATFGPPIASSDTVTDKLRQTVVPRTITNHNIRIVVFERESSVSETC